MISLSSTFFNIFLNNFSDLQDNYLKYVHDLDLSSLPCPNPSCDTSDLSFNTSYCRYVIFSPDHDPLTMEIMVVRCNHCGSYHALLPASLFPYHSYTYHFVMSAMYLYYCSSFRSNKSKVCEAMKIHRSTLNRWIKLINHQDVISFLDECISSFFSKLRDRKIDFFAFLKEFSSTNAPFLCTSIRRSFHFILYSNNSDNCFSP